MGIIEYNRIQRHQPLIMGTSALDLNCNDFYCIVRDSYNRLFSHDSADVVEIVPTQSNMYMIQQIYLDLAESTEPLVIDGIEIKFTDDYWDFSSKYKAGKTIGNYSYNFDSAYPLTDESRETLIIDTIRKNAKKIGYDFDALSTKDQQYLVTIETAITEIFELEQQAREMISKNTVSVKGVASRTKIARQTLYNNPILKEYINYRSKSFDKVDASKKNTARDEEIKALREEITALHRRDVELAEAKRQIQELKKQLKEKDDVIASLRKSSKGNIFSFHPNNYN